MKLYKLLLASLFTGASLTTFAAPVIGTYQCQGYDPVLQKKYNVTTTIKKKDHIYHVTWVTDDGRKFTGTGLLENNVLALVYKQTSHPSEVSGLGMQLYTMQDNKMLGKWIFDGSKVVGTEICEKTKKR